MDTTLTTLIPCIDPDNHADFPIEDLGHGAIFQWQDGGRILYTRMDGSSQITWDTWESGFRAIQANWPPERKTLYVFYDLTSPEFGVTLYMSQKVRELLTVKRPYRLVGAFLLIDSSLASMVAFMLRSYRRSDQISFTSYTDYYEAQSWLREKMWFDDEKY